MKIEDHEVDFHDVSLLPDQRSVMFVTHQSAPETGDWIEDSSIIVLRDGARQVIRLEEGVLSPASPIYSQGHLLYEREDAAAGLWAVPFSPERLETTGAPFLLVAGGRRPSVAEDGTLAYLPGASAEGVEPIQLVWVDREGRQLGDLGPARRMSHYFDLSPDGRHVLISAFTDPGEADVWVLGTDGNRSYPLTRDPGVEGFGNWSADGRDVYYLRTPQSCGGSSCIEAVSLRADGSGEETVIDAAGFFPHPSPDGKSLLYSVMIGGSDGGIALVERPMDGSGAHRRLFQDSRQRFFSRFSPDGRFMAYVSEHLDGRHVMISTYPDLAETIQVSDDRGEWPVWDPAGDKLYFVRRYDVLEVELTLEPNLRAGPPRKLFSLQEYAFDTSFGSTPHFDVDADGERFLVTRVDLANKASRGIVVVQNWVAEYEDP